MKVVKTNLRSKLRSTSLSDQLMVVMESPDISDFDPEEAIALWHSEGCRVKV